MLVEEFFSVHVDSLFRNTVWVKLPVVLALSHFLDFK